MPLQEAVDRRENRIAELLRLAARLQLAQQRRQQRDAGEECDQHADAGDQSELGQAAIRRRQERQEAGGRGKRGERQRRAGAPAGVQQRLAQAVNLVPLGPVTHTVLEAEIDPEADKQHGEIDRDQIERADHHHADRRGDRKPDDKAHKHGEDDAEPTQRQPENEQHHRNGDGGVERRIFLDGGELFVGHGHRAGQAHARLIGRCEIELVGGVANGVACLEPGLERGKVEHRANAQEPPQVIGFRHLALGECVPGEARRPVGVDLVERVGCERHRPSHLVERDLAALHADQAELQPADDTAEAGIGREVLQQSLGLGQHLHLRRELLGRLEQKAVLGEERTALRLLDRTEKILLLRQATDQRCGRLVGELSRRGVDDGNDRLVLGKGLFERQFPLPPDAVGGNELVDVGRQQEMRGGIPRAKDGKNDRSGDDPPGVARAKADCADDESGDRLHRISAVKLAGEAERRDGGAQDRAAIAPAAQRPVSKRLALAGSTAAQPSAHLS